MVNKGEIDMQKLVVDAPDKLEKGESFGPGGVRINGKMKIQYKNPETLENYLKRENKTQYTRNINAVCGNEKVDNRMTKIAKVFARELIYEGWRRHGNEMVDFLWNGIDKIFRMKDTESSIKAVQIMEQNKARVQYPYNTVLFQQRQQNDSTRDSSVC